MTMHILKNRSFRIFAIVMAMILLIIVILQFGAKRYIVNLLNVKIPDDMHIGYKQMGVNVLSGSIELQDVILELRDKGTGDKHLELRSETLNLDGLGYLNYLFGNTISLNEIKLLRPKVNYYPGQFPTKHDTIRTKALVMETALTIANLSIVDGEFQVIEKGTDSLDFLVEKVNLSVDNLKMDQDFIGRKIPISYGDYNLSTGKLFVDLGPFEALTVRGVSIQNKDVQLNNLSLRSKYNKVALSRKLDKEHDYIDLEIPQVKLSKMDFGFNSDQFYLRTNLVQIHNPTLFLYRDKLIQDDWEQKKLYSRMLRELPIDLDISEVDIANGHITYAELVEEGTTAGELVFSDLDATLNNISNTYENIEETKIEARAKLMGKAQIQLRWNFDTSKENDAFYISGEVKDFDSESFNQFLQSNLRAEAEGDIKELYFTISGDAISASGDMKMKYEDFYFKVLKKDRLGVNKLLTFVGNMFTNDGSKTDAMGYRHGEIFAKRDGTKSFFNYLWLTVKDGIVNTLTGDGKKE